MNDSAYWPDAGDPLGRVHGRDKVNELELECTALCLMLMKKTGLSKHADMIAESMEGRISRFGLTEVNALNRYNRMLVQAEAMLNRREGGDGNVHH